MKISVGDQLEIKIEKLVAGGSGLSRHHGAVIFVPKSAPQDFLKVEIVEAKKNFYTAKILKIIEASPDRRIPPCPYFENCGGCSWQHLMDSSQLKFKHRLIQEIFSQFIPEMPLPGFEILESPQNFRYRNRIQPKIQNSRIGFYGAGTHDLVEITDCLIAEEKLMSAWPRFKKEIAEKKQAQGRYELYLDENENPRWYETGEEKDSLGFSQVNRFQNDQMIHKLIEWSENFPVKPSRVIDLYAGAGNLSFPLSKTFKKIPVIAVEQHPGLAQAARKKANELNLSPKNFEVFCADVSHFLKRFQLNKDDLIILDPPRTGTDPLVMKTLAAAGISRFIYVSCHPVTLARDLKVFYDQLQLVQHKPRIEKLLALDMFPQTHHIELLSEVRIDS